MPSSARATKVPTMPQMSREENGFGEQLAHNGPAAGTERETDGEFARAVGSACGEDACKVGAGRQQYERREQRHAEQSRLHRAVAVARRAGQAHADNKPLIHRIVLRHRCCNGIQVVGSLLRRYLRPEPANQSKVAMGAPVKIIPAGDLFGV